MTLEQMSTIKRWHQRHRHHHPVEGWAWDLVLTLWVMSFPGIAVGVIIGSPAVAVVCAITAGLPSVYAAARRTLHRRGVLRCDWLGAAAP